LAILRHTASIDSHKLAAPRKTEEEHRRLAQGYFCLRSSNKHWHGIGMAWAQHGNSAGQE